MKERILLGTLLGDASIGKLTGKISDEKMIKMNYAVEIEKKDPALVAKEFLREEGMI